MTETPVDLIVRKLSALAPRHCRDLSAAPGADDPQVQGVAALIHEHTTLGFLAGRRGEPLRLMVEDHFDLSVDVCVKDGELGTLGLIHVVPNEPRDYAGASITAEDWCRQRVDEAVYLRHLLLTRTRNPDTRPRPLAYTVELVLAVSGAHKDDRTQDVGRALRVIATSGSFLHAIGINLWRLDDETAAQAMPWLLNATLAAIAQLPRMLETPPPPIPLTSLTLEHFRVQGKRLLEFDANAAVHLVHGSNGSGKSSIVEAIELAVSGRIGRLERPGTKTDYARILRNHDVIQPATIRFNKSDAVEVTADGLDETKLPWKVDRKHCGNSFRLNQELADSLASSSPGERAAIFVEAFFPDKAEGLANRRDAVAEFESASQAVPSWARVELGEPTASPGEHASDLEERLAWIGEQVDWRRVVDLLRRAIGATDTEWMSKFPEAAQKRFRETGILGWEHALSQAAELDTALGAVRTTLEANGQHLPPAIAALEALNARTLGTRSESVDDVPRVFDQWLEAVAEADLAAKLSDVAEVMRAVEQRGTGYTPRPAFGSFVTGLGAKWSSASRAFRSRPPALADRAEQLRVRVSGTATASTPPTLQVSASERPLEEFKLDALDGVAAAGFLGPDYEHVPLAEAVRTAFERQQPHDVTIGDKVLLKIGEPGWAGGLLDRLRRENSIIESFNANAASIGSLVDGLKTLRRVRDAARSVVASEKKADRTLQALLTDGAGPDANGSLLHALNEVKALLTPARWAYRPIRAAANFTRTNELHLREDDDVAISQRLNTAELNITALALFFICTRRVPNPLRLLVLDDPLQNMDEITVTTVARAIGRFIRLWEITGASRDAAPRDDWRILLLLHGQDDVERFRVELPSAFYRLPWLEPIGKATGVPPIKNEGSLLGEKLQALDLIGEDGRPADDASPPPTP